MVKLTATGLLLLLVSSQSTAEIRTQKVAYEQAGVKLEGLLAWDDSSSAKRPGVLVVHEWWGLDDYASGRAEQLAALGYVAFALDMYGTGKHTRHLTEAGKWSSAINKNVDAWRARAVAGLEVLKKHEAVDANRLAAIGYCFGGATVMELAYAGTELAGVVSFHGSLPVVKEGDAGQIRARILVCHGANDALVPAERIDQFRAALDKATADWQMVYYGGAKHSFTNPQADSYGLPVLGYNEKADARSWSHMQSFLDEIFE